MKRFVLLDTAPIPDGSGALCLFEYGEDFVIKIAGGDGGQLMNTRMHGSEDALAAIPCKKVAGRPDSRVLIGGLGMGFTLAAALQNLGKSAEVEVAELVPGVVEWNRGPLGAKAGYPILDPRRQTDGFLDGCRPVDIGGALREQRHQFLIQPVDLAGNGGKQRGQAHLLVQVGGVEALRRRRSSRPARCRR